MMAEFDQGAHLCVPLLPPIDAAELLPRNWNAALLNSFFIFYHF